MKAGALAEVRRGLLSRMSPWKEKPRGENKNGSNFNETVTRSRCTLWTPD